MADLDDIQVSVQAIYDGMLGMQGEQEDTNRLLKELVNISRQILSELNDIERKLK
jgi:hypothetical protein